MNRRVIDPTQYYRAGVYRHFSADCKCSFSITNRVDVTGLYEVSKRTGTRFYINFLYLLTKALNTREDYRMGYLFQTGEVVVYDQINPIQYIFHEDTETFTIAYTTYDPDYRVFYEACAQDADRAAQTREYGLDEANHPNWFDASCIPWLSYDAMHVELPDGYLYFPPIVNWGRFRKEEGRLMMPVSIRLNHAAADGYLCAKAFLILQEEIDRFAKTH